MEIGNYSKNCMGTVSFDGKFAGMRKAQDFIVYPMREASAYIKIQSDKRSGHISLVSGQVVLYPGQYFNGIPKQAGVLSAADLLVLKGNVMASASGMAGTNGAVYCDNSAAIDVFNV